MKLKLTVEKKLLIYKILLFIFAFFIAFMPTTAMRSKEVNSRVIVEILGIDCGEKVSLTAQYVMPTESQGTTSKDTVTVESGSLTEAVEMLNTALGRRAELGHCSMVVIGSDVKPEILGSLMTVTDVTADVYVSAAKDKAEDFVSDITEFMKKTGATDADFIAYGAKRAHVATNTLLGFLSDLGSASESTFIPVVEMIEEQPDGGSGGDSDGSSGEESGGGKSGESGSGGDSKQIGMKVERLALYGKDGRRGILERDSARGVAWVSSPIEKGTITADIEFNGKTIEGLSGRLIKKHSSVKTSGRGKATVKVKAYIEPTGDKFNEIGAANSLKATAALKNGFAEKIESEIDRAFFDALSLGCDPLFIGRQFYRYDPDYFESTFDLNNVSVNYDIEIVIK